MCDYSLEHLASRKAEVGDKLVIPRFTHGFMRPADVKKATARVKQDGYHDNRLVCMTCLKKGTVLRLTRPMIGVDTVTVGKRDKSVYVDDYKDVLIYSDGTQHPIAHHNSGTTATVVSIPGVKSKAKAKPKAKKQSLETRLGLDKLNAKLNTAKEPSKLRKALAKVSRRSVTLRTY